MRILKTNAIMTKICQIKLQPLTNFYFGGEHNFSKGYDAKKNEQNYFVRSTYYPQQSALLGMLRQEVLIQNEQMPIKDKAKAKALIGEASFNADVAGDFGKIKRLSPIFLSDESRHYVPLSRSFIFDKKAKTFTATQFTAESSFKAVFNGIERPCPALSDFNYKKGFAEGVVSLDSKKDKILYEDLFKESERIGIQKHAWRNNKKTDEAKADTQNEAFYKQVSYIFSQKHRKMVFSCFVEIDDDLELKDNLVFMGGERSAFKMTVEDGSSVFSFEKPTDFFKTAYDTEGGVSSGLTLISDSFIPSALFNTVLFAQNDSVSFRNFRTSVTNTVHWSAMTDYDKNLIATNKQWTFGTAPMRSQQCFLLKRGSQLFFENQTQKEAFEKALENSPFRRIGCNYSV
jgi:CRISPR-associated protein Cmr3